MPVTAGAPMRPFVVGANHRSSSVGLRDRLFLDEGKASLFLARLAEKGIAQAIVLSTCDRVEIQSVAADPDGGAKIVRKMLVTGSGESGDAIAEQIYEYCDEAAVRQIFAVAASLDSQTVGEPQVLGQVKEGHRFAQGCGMVGVELETLLQAAYTVAKRVRSETEIGHHPVSIASAAGRIARDVQGDLSDARLLVVGLADMGDIIVDQLRAAGASRITMSGPSRRTEATARRAGHGFVPFDAFDAALKDAEIVVAAAGSGRRLVTSAAMEGALAARRRRPVLLIDAGVPGDVDPGVGDLEGAFLFTLDDLERVAMEGRSTRGAAADSAWDIVDQEVAAWRRNRAARDAVPAIVALRKHFEATREGLLAAEPDADADAATRMLINKLLHEPSRAMREIAETESGNRANYVATAEQLMRRLFNLGAKEDGNKK